MRTKTPQRNSEGAANAKPAVSDFQATTEVRKEYYSKLHSAEVYICTLLWGGGVIVTVCSLIPLSSSHENKFVEKGLLADGWTDWLGRHLDNTDLEWSLWKDYVWDGYIRGFTGHFIVARLTDNIFPEIRFQILLAYSLAFTAYFLHIEGVLYLLSHVVIQFWTVRLTKSVTACWITGLGLLYILQNKNEALIAFYKSDPHKMYILLVCVAMSILRCIGFGLEYVWQHRRKCELTADKSRLLKKSTTQYYDDGEDADLTFVDLLMYQMYFPLLLGGPVMNYYEFAEQAKRPPPPWTFTRTTKFIMNLVKYATFHIFIDFVLHYVYASALVYENWSSSKKLKIYHLCGLSMAQVGLFYFKFLMMFGLPAHLATSDGLDTPGQPQCVYSKHRMTDFWKLIDKGLHKWVVRYIYIPCGGSQNGPLRAILSLATSFTFVVLWHGPTRRHIRWGVMNWFGVLVEYIAMEIYRTDAVKDLERRYFTLQWSRRFRGFLSCFMFGFLIVTNLTFLAGIKMGDIYISRFYTENLLATILIHISLYGGVQSSMNSE